MAIRITEDGVVTYENEPDIDRELFPNIQEGGGSPEQIAQAVADWFEDHPEAVAPVQDVQVNETSIVTDGVANVPVASSTKFGAVKAEINYGLDATSSGLRVYMAHSNLIKLATGSGSNYQPITPFYQHESTFYGLARAAGDITQSASSNAVGNYTEDAKSAIQIMLGISAIIGSVEGVTSSTGYSTGDLFLHSGALYKATAAIASGDAIVPGTNCEQTTIIDILKGE